MIVVDTSVCVDHLRGKETPGVARLRDDLMRGEGVAISGIIRTELLQGVAEHSVGALTRELEALPLVVYEATDFDLAAWLYRAAREAGMTVRNVTDCLIAAPCIRLGVPILHSDADFDKVASISELRLVAV